MKFSIARTSTMHMGSEEPPAPGAVLSSDKKTWHIEIGTLEALTNMIDILEEPLILSRRGGPKSLVAIEIYDDMREDM